jgi:hypothetical protein
MGLWRLLRGAGADPSRTPICGARAPDLRCAGLGNQRSFLGEAGEKQVKKCGSTHIGSPSGCEPLIPLYLSAFYSFYTDLEFRLACREILFCC